MIVMDRGAVYFSPVMWVFELIKNAYGIDLIHSQLYILKVGTEPHNDLLLSSTFYNDLLHKKIYDYQHYFQSVPLIKNEDGNPDYISTIFYLVNGFQEFDLKASQKDRYGRLKFQCSLQYNFDIIEEDLVKNYVQKLLAQIDVRLKLPFKKSRVFLSHDIDSVFGSLKYDGLWALKAGKIGSMLTVIWETILRRPPWFNIDKVASLESSYDLKACYYWIVENGRANSGEKNGDYAFHNPKIQSQFQYAKTLGNEMGLHKSSMPQSIVEEHTKIHEATSNRFHFLKINNPVSFQELEDSGFGSDSSIGFPYAMGFKNSFGMPYFPYNIDKNKRYKVLEIPLQIMDGMFQINDESSAKKAKKQLIGFIEKNNTDALISLLWHNSEMTNFAYRWSFEVYKALLLYFYEHQFETVLPSQLVQEYNTSS